MIIFNLFVFIDCTYPGSRFKDEVTEYYYGNDDNRHTPVSKPSFDNHLETLDERYGRTYNTRNKGKINNILYSIKYFCLYL